MNTAASSEPRIVSLDVTDDAIVAQLADGRTIGVPLAWSWRLANATPAQRKRFELIGSAKESIGPTWMKTSVPEGCCRGRQRVHRNRSRKDAADREVTS